jgi:pimeloyl-ACP methyl ester carboxylesterase
MEGGGVVMPAFFSSWPAYMPPLEHPCKAVVFIHGIFSTHETFAEMRSRLSQHPNFANVRFFYYDYDYHNSLAQNGTHFAAQLGRAFGPEDDVAVVSHSMGGLVTRLAVLTTPMPFLRAAFLLGTPNSGAVRLSQLALLSQMVHGSVGRFFALFPRKSGISDLSRAAQIIRRNLDNAANAGDVDYVTIPGMFFHAERKPWELGSGLAAFGFAVWDLALSRIFLVHMNRPHDGIVEEASNNLMTCRPGIWHEKMNSIGPQRGQNPATYAHVRVNACEGLNHVQIHNDPVVIETVADITSRKLGLGGLPGAAAPPARIEDWVRNLTAAQRANLQVMLAIP